MTVLSARDFNQDVSAAKRAASNGPVIITNRGVPAFVLMTYAAYLRDNERAKPPTSIVELLACEDEFDFDPQPIGSLPRVPDL